MNYPRAKDDLVFSINNNMKNNEKIDIEHKDSKGFYHGYQEWYFNDYIWVRKKSRHGLNLGYLENHKNRTIIFYIR